MKPFNLEEALAGEPVILKNGKKAYIGLNLYNLGVLESTTVYPLQGVIIEKDGSDFNDESWTLDGKRDVSKNFDSLDIIGMWEEPIKLEDLPKPFIPKQGEKYYSISPDYMRPEYKYANCLNHYSIQNGNCFKTEEDAQKWIDFMKQMKD